MIGARSAPISPLKRARKHSSLLGRQAVSQSTLPEGGFGICQQRWGAREGLEPNQERLWPLVAKRCYAAIDVEPAVSFFPNRRRIVRGLIRSSWAARSRLLRVYWSTVRMTVSLISRIGVPKVKVSVKVGCISAGVSPFIGLTGRGATPNSRGSAGRGLLKGFMIYTSSGCGHGSGPFVSILGSQAIFTELVDPQSVSLSTTSHNQRQIELVRA